MSTAKNEARAASRTSGIVGAALACVLATAAWADEVPPLDRPCQVVDPERPYVCDIGPPQPLSMRSFKEVLARDGAVRALVRRIGMPYAVEMQRVRVEDPWYTWELRAYYPTYDRMYAFGRAFILGVPEVSLMRYEGPIPPDRWRTATTTVSAPRGDAEAAALRAEQAAAEAEALADRADRYADRAEAIADQAGQDFKRSLFKN
jgi:hypothetical protein